MKLLHLITSFLVICLAVYLFYSFILWDFNPQNYSVEVRGSMVFIQILFFVTVVVVIRIQEPQEKKSLDIKSLDELEYHINKLKEKKGQKKVLEYLSQLYEKIL